MDNRELALKQWLETQCLLSPLQWVALQGDASFRRYFRVTHQQASYIVMDAPPPRENCRPFIAIAQALAETGLFVPEIIAADEAQGFLLLKDFGDRLFLKELNSTNVEPMYERALRALSILQTCRVVKGWNIPAFTAEFMYQELQLFKEWFLLTYLKLSLSVDDEKMLARMFNFLAQSAAEQPQVFMHRDFHSANLMVLPDFEVGILDFQDAFIGPVTYDLVSLLRDCYIDWPLEVVHKLALFYKEKLLQLSSISNTDFLRMFDLMGLQRHLKALLTFSRKYCRDANSNYLQYVPRTLNYIVNISEAYPECLAFNNFLKQRVSPALQKVSVICAP